MKPKVDWSLGKEKAYEEIVDASRKIIDRIKEFPFLLDQLCEEIEVALIRIALDRSSWNKTKAAKLLGLKRTTLIEKVKRFSAELEAIGKKCD